MVYITKPEDMDKYFEAAKMMVGEKAKASKAVPLEKQADEEDKTPKEMEGPPKGVVY